MDGQTSSTGAVRAASIIVLAGGVILLLAYLAMPFVTLSFLGSVSGVQLAGYASQEETLGLLWLVFPAAAAIAGIGAWQQFATSASPAARRRGSQVALGLSTTVVIIYIIVYGVAAEAIAGSGAGRFGISASSIIGGGYWIALLAAIAAGVGATIGLLVRRLSAPGSGR